MTKIKSKVKPFDKKRDILTDFFGPPNKVLNSDINKKLYDQMKEFCDLYSHANTLTEGGIVKISDLDGNFSFYYLCFERGSYCIEIVGSSDKGEPSYQALYMDKNPVRYRCGRNFPTIEEALRNLSTIIFPD